VIRKHLGFGLNMGALLLFFPGILLPMFALDMEMAATLGSSTLTTPLLNKELSILATVRELWDDQRTLVAALIFIFSICIPLLKTSLLLIAYVKKHTGVESRLLNFVAHIGKWSMADVFVVAVFLAILSTQHSETAASHQISVFGFKLMLDVSTETLSAAGPGFYYFTAYCLVSLLGTHLAWSSLKNRGQ
jgi:paraquat-inducible protein A